MNVYIDTEHHYLWKHAELVHLIYCDPSLGIHSATVNDKGTPSGVLGSPSANRWLLDCFLVELQKNVSSPPLFRSGFYCSYSGIHCVPSCCQTT